jgi:hypothetical protein
MLRPSDIKGHLYEPQIVMVNPPSKKYTKKKANLRLHLTFYLINP